MYICICIYVYFLLLWSPIRKSPQECIPTLRGDKTSRAQVLKKTGDYIVHMQVSLLILVIVIILILTPPQKKINNHTDEIKSLKEQNSALEQQIKALEKAKAQGNFVSGDLLEVRGAGCLGGVSSEQ